MINCIGQLFGSSGYSNHFRSLVNELNKLVPCKISTNLHPGFEREINDAELEMIKRQEDYDINLVVTHPVNWKNNLNAKRNFVYLVWEGDRLPKWILEECENDKIEKIICPSTHTLDAVKHTEGFDNYPPSFINKFVVIPHGVDLETFYPIETKKDTFRFLANKGLRNLEDRGGIQYLIRAYLDEFKPEENVELVLKINPAYGVPNLLKMFPELTGKIPKITYIPENYTKEQLNKLYNECDVFVSPTRAEAFNLPCLEALACGKPVITTNYGGQTDFCSKNTGWLVDYDLVDVQHELEYEGIKWATPKIDDLRKKLRIATELSFPKEALVNVALSLTWENTAKQIHTLF